MTWLAVRLFLGGFLKKLGSLNLWQLLCIGLALFAGLQTVRLAAEKRHAAKTEAQLLKCDQQRHADREAYAKAQADAQAQNLAQVHKIEQEQQKVTDDVEADYSRKLAALRGELRGQGGTPQSHPGSAGISQVPDASAKPDAEAVPLPPDELLRARETELQLNALIDWIEQQQGASK